MAPILDTLREDYAGRLKFSFIDVTDDFDAAKPYRIRIIPTQIFYDAEGNELFRHEGFYSRSQILRKWRSLGYTFEEWGQAQ
jgi:thioredoxin 1